MLDFLTTIWNANKTYVYIACACIAAIILIGVFVPSARPAIGWLFAAIKTVLELAYQAISIPAKVVG